MEAQAEAAANFCGIFGNPRRVLIVWALEEKELSVGEIAQATSDTLQNTSRHLHRMKDRGVLTSRRRGQTVYYRILNQEVLTYCHHLMAVPKSLVLQDRRFTSHPNEEGVTP